MSEGGAGTLAALLALAALKILHRRKQDRRMGSRETALSNRNPGLSIFGSGLLGAKPLI
jgi:hypothetical protein